MTKNSSSAGRAAGASRTVSRAVLIGCLGALTLACRDDDRATAEPRPRAPEAVASQRPAADPAVDTGATQAQPKDVSIIELLAAPERFRGQRVRLIGFVALEHEGNAVYLHEEDYRRTITRNALWLDVQRTEPPRLAAPGYAIIEGRFEPERHGHMDLFSGTLTQVDRMTPWAGREPAKP